MTFDVNAARQAAFHKLALQTPRHVTLDGDDLSLLAGALTAFHTLGDKNGAAQTMHERFDHQRAVEELADKLGVTLGTWESTEVVTVPEESEVPGTRPDFDMSRTSIAQLAVATRKAADEQWRARVAEESARESNARRYPLEVEG